MELPANVKEWALNYKQKSPIFTIMLEGSSGERIYPKIKWWKRAMLSLKREYPDACFILTGLTPKYSVYRKKIYDWQFINLANTVPDTYNFYDIGLEKQLALIEMSDVFISPHSGFAFLAPCLGTPWLCISGAYWSEQEFAHMPFYSVIPKCTHYPCINDTKLECKLRLSLKLNVKCMGNDLNNKIHDILNGTELLLRKNMDFDQSMLKYKNQLKLNKVNIQKVNLINEYDISIVK
jgi:hypothetical protein